MSEQNSLENKLRNPLYRKRDVEVIDDKQADVSVEDNRFNPAVYQLGYTDADVDAEVAQAEQQTASIDEIGEISALANQLDAVVKEYQPRSIGVIKTLDANFKRIAEHQKESNEKILEAFQKKASEPREIDISDKKAPEEKSFLDKIKDTIASSCGIAKNILFETGKAIVKPVGAGVIKMVSSPVGAGIVAGAGIATIGAGVSYLASENSGSLSSGISFKNATPEALRAINTASKLSNIPSEFILTHMMQESGVGGKIGNSPVAKKNYNFTGITWSPNLQKILDRAGIKAEKGSARPPKEGGNYVRFETPEEYGKYYADLVRRLYPKAQGAKTMEEFAYGLQHGVKGRKWADQNDGVYERELMRTYKTQIKGKVKLTDASPDYNNGVATETNGDNNPLLPTIFRKHSGLEYSQNRRTSNTAADCSSLVDRLIYDITKGEVDYRWNTTQGLVQKGESVSFGNIAPGDLVFWNRKDKNTGKITRNGHVEMYAGNGQTFGTNTPGQVSRYRGLNENGRQSQITAVRRIKKVYNIINA